MADTTRVKYISPMLLVSDMEATLAFYETVLGFRTIRKAAEYSIIIRDDRRIHLKLAWSDEVMRSARDHTEIYIEVDGIDALWKHVKTFKDRYQVRDLFDRTYGMTEFHIIDPNGCLIFVGEVTSERNSSAHIERGIIHGTCPWHRRRLLQITLTQGHDRLVQARPQL